MSNPVDRRRFLHHVASALPLLHAAPLIAMAMDDKPEVKAAPARFAALQLRTAVDLEQMAAFYRDTLRLPSKMNDAGLRVTAGETTIDFSKIDARPGATDPYYHFAFNIPHNQLEAAKTWLEPRCPLVKRADGGVIFHFEGWNAHAFYFLDPAGNILEFIARHTLENERDDAFSESNILCASEIGVVAPDVVKTADQICEAVKLERYHGGSEQFTAVGDEQGLFIVVRTGRAWFSSNRKAEVFDAEAVLRSDTATARLQLPDSRFEASHFPSSGGPAQPK
jgi:hypothetical protein